MSVVRIGPIGDSADPKLPLDAAVGRGLAAAEVTTALLATGAIPAGTTTADGVGTEATAAACSVPVTGLDTEAARRVSGAEASGLAADAGGESWAARETDGDTVKVDPTAGELCLEMSTADIVEAALRTRPATPTRAPRPASGTTPGRTGSAGLIVGSGAPRGANPARTGELPESVGEAEVPAESLMSANATAGTATVHAPTPRANVAAAALTSIHTTAIAPSQREPQT